MSDTAPIVGPAACVGPGASFRCYDSIVRLEASDGAVLTAMRDRLPPFAEPAGDLDLAALRLFLRGPGRCRCGGTHLTADLFRNGVFECAGSTAAMVLRASRIAKFFVAERASDRVFIHAGAVAWHGRTIVLPGRSMSGKTTLVRALLDQGATYYSDEYAVIDARGSIHAFPQPLGLRVPGDDTQHPAPIESLGYVPGTDPLPVAAIVVTEYRLGAVWAPARLSRARAILELTAHAVPIARAPERVLDFIGAAVERADGFAGERGDAALTARAILDLIRS